VTYYQVYADSEQIISVVMQTSLSIVQFLEHS